MTAPDEVCGVVLAAGNGIRLRPLTELRPKPLCPVGNLPLLDWALRRLAAVGLSGAGAVAVNASYLADQVAVHVGAAVHLSREVPAPLGTSGAIAQLRSWAGGRGVLVTNSDAFLAADPAHAAAEPTAELAGLLADWDGQTVRLLGVPAPGPHVFNFGGHVFAGACLLPWDVVAGLPEGPSDLVHTAWRPAERAGRLEVIEFPGTYLDTGTPADYLTANLLAAEGGNLVAPEAMVKGELHRAVVGAGATVLGRVTRGVVWPGAWVGEDEHLVDAVRAGRDLTVTAAPDSREDR
jgi:NDP-sugar pyrophosphorylase family protein